MSRPAAVVHRVIKAYDVRGLVGEEIDESFVADVGAAFACLLRDEDQSRSVPDGRSDQPRSVPDGRSDQPRSVPDGRSDQPRSVPDGRSDQPRSAVVVGYDMRESSPTLAAAFASGVRSQGIDTIDIGLASTDQLYFASGLLDCPGAMFTASHNPAAYNGIKLCRAGAKPVGADSGLTVIRDEVIAGVPGYDGPAGTISDRDVLADYG